LWAENVVRHLVQKWPLFWPRSPKAQIIALRRVSDLTANDAAKARLPTQAKRQSRLWNSHTQGCDKMPHDFFSKGGKIIGYALFAPPAYRFGFTLWTNVRRCL
jgi:hypothetical protein